MDDAQQHIQTGTRDLSLKQSLCLASIDVQHHKVTRNGDIIILHSKGRGTSISWHPVGTHSEQAAKPQKICHHALFSTMWWFIRATFPSEFLSLIRIFYLWLQIMSMIKNSRVLRFLSPECGPAGLGKLHDTLQFTHHFWNSHFWGLFKLSLVKIKMGIYSEDLPGRNFRWLFSVIVIGRGNFEKKITQIMITLNGDSNQITIPNQMIADHQYPENNYDWALFLSPLGKSSTWSGNDNFPSSNTKNDSQTGTETTASSRSCLGRPTTRERELNLNDPTDRHVRSAR